MLILTLLFLNNFGSGAKLLMVILLTGAETVGDLGKYRKSSTSLSINLWSHSNL